MNYDQIIEAVKKALEGKANFEEPSCADIRVLISDFIEAGLSGELTGKAWSPRYGEMTNYYLSKYLQEAEELGYGECPLKSSTIRRVLNYKNRDTSEKRNRYASLIAFIKYLIIIGLVDRATLEEIKLLRPKRSTPVKKKFITRDEIERIISHVKQCKFTDEYDKNLLITVIETADETGLRIGEICGIRVKDLNLANQELYIPRAKGGFDFTKGLTSKAVNIIQKYLQARPKTESLNLFVLENGKPLTRETLIQRFRRVTKKLGLDTGFHAFRRRYISRHLQDGKSLVDVSLAVNHRSPRMTEQYLIPDVQKSIKEQKQW